MDFAEYQALSKATDDRMPDGLPGVRLLLLGMTGEAGSAAAAAKKDYRDSGTEPLEELMVEELGDVLWYLAAVARRLNIDLNAVAERNLAKTGAMFGEPSYPEPFDEVFPEQERFPRRFSVRFVTAAGPGGVLRSEMHAVDPDLAALVRSRNADGSTLIGDPIDDNSAIDDGYRFHDVLHLAHAAVLGWSPVLRSLLGLKRRSDPDTDRVEDGARAIAIEEGLAAIVFRELERLRFTVSGHLPHGLLKQIAWLTRGHEAAAVAPLAWSTTYEQATEVLRHLRAEGAGIVHCDLDARSLESMPSS